MSRYRPTLLLAAALLAGCASTSESYVADQAGYAVTRGRITRIENLHTEKIEALADGVAVTLSQAGCRLSLRFEDDRSQLMDLGADVILVFGAGQDYVLRSEAARR